MDNQAPEQLLLDLIEPEAPTLENFVADGNEELVAALRAARALEGPQFIYLWGEPGSGRTHLLRALTPTQRWRVPEYDPREHLYTVDNVELLDEDDQEKLFFLMNDVRSRPECRLVVAGRLRVDALKDVPVREDVCTRLCWGLVYRLRPLSGAAALSQFVRLARSRGLEASDETVRWLEAHAPRSMPALAQLLEIVDRRAMRQKRRLTVPLLNESMVELSGR